MRGLVVMIGPALDSPGGMSSVAQSYHEAGLFERWQVRYLASYRHPRLGDKLLRLMQTLLALSWALLLRRVALLHVHTASRGSFWRKSLFVALARAFRVPVVLHVHSGEFMRFYGEECGPGRRALVRWILRCSACVLCLTPRWREALARVEPRARLRVLPNPAPDEPLVRARRASGSVQPGCVLFLGRLREKKGVFDLLHAWPAVLAAWPQARLVLAGDGDAQSIVELARKLQVADAIVLPGWVADAAKAEWLARAEVFVLPSHAEGLPVCVLEAMACGIPVLATRVGGVPDVVADGQEGLLVDAGDVAGLQAALLGLLGDAVLRQRLAAAALMRVEREFALPQVLAALETLWGELIGLPPGGGAVQARGASV